MHKIHIDGGSYNLIYQLPQIIYSSIISSILSYIIKLLGLSESNILQLKNSKKNVVVNIDIKVKSLITILKIKFSFFYVSLFILLGIFWYYVTCFCGI